MGKKYDQLRLRNVDEQGRLVYHYGCNGRSISYEDTTPLNYRKKEAWDLLINEALTVVEQFGVDGLYLDNGFEWPELYKINEEEMFRRDFEDRSPAYTYDQIFEGEVVHNNKTTGYWSSRIFIKFPNPFLVKFCKGLWQRHPSLLIIA